MRRGKIALRMLEGKPRTMTHIAFIGLGNMGRPMAANLARADCGVRGFDLVPLLRDNAAKEGVLISGSAEEALAGAEVVITMLPGGKHVLSVWTDLLPHARKGTLFIDSSTIDPTTAFCACTQAKMRLLEVSNS